MLGSRLPRSSRAGGDGNAGEVEGRPSSESLDDASQAWRGSERGMGTGSVDSC